MSEVFCPFPVTILPISGFRIINLIVFRSQVAKVIMILELATIIKFRLYIGRAVRPVSRTWCLLVLSPGKLLGLSLKKWQITSLFLKISRLWFKVSCCRSITLFQIHISRDILRITRSLCLEIWRQFATQRQGVLPSNLINWNTS